MALGDPYADLTAFKAYLQIGDNVDNTELDDALNAASRGIELFCDRQFNDAGTASARVFYPDAVDLLRVDDFYTTTGLVVATDDDDDGTFEATWDASDYQLEPLNGIVEGQPGWPYDRVRAVGSLYFPGVCGRAGVIGRSRPHTRVGRARVQVTARWGWAAVPDPVRQACLILAAELFKLRSAPFGVAGFGEYGVVRVRENPKVCALLKPYERYPVMVA